MQLGEIKSEIGGIVPHQTHCKTLKPEPGECNCNHDNVTNKLNDLFINVLKGRK